MTGPRVALVTGANRGLGLETSRQLLDKGLNVVLTGRDAGALDRVIRSLDRDEKHAIAVRMDVTDVASIEAAHAIVMDRFGGVDVLVNNAAVLLSENDDVLSIPSDASGYFGFLGVIAVLLILFVIAKNGRGSQVALIALFLFGSFTAWGADWPTARGNAQRL